MNSRLKILVEAAAGAAGGFLAWVIVEPIPFLSRDPRPGEAPPDVATFWWQLMLFGAVMGACIGGFLGAAEGLSTGSRKQFNRALGIGAGIGLLGGMVGLYFGQNIYQLLVPDPAQRGAVVGALAFVMGVIARAVGWALVGTCVGFAQGIPTGSTRKMRHGLIGGLIGGALGGVLFQFLGEILHTPELSRLVGMTVTGGFIGFFIGLVQDLMKQAWVVVLRGRNEGREYVLDKPESVLGRDELAEVGVFGDTAVAPKHALIRGSGGLYVVEDLGSSPAGTVVNGQRIASHGLADGDVITLGGTQIVFHEKVGAVPVRQARDVAAPTRAQAVPAADNTCAFCGQLKDPRTGACACTPVAQPVPGFTPAPESAGASWSMGTAATAPGVPAPSPAPAMGGGPRLVAVSGPLAGQVLSLRGPEVTVGRDASRDVVLGGDATVSRRHAVLRAEGAGYAVVDEGSANGVFVNGQRVPAQSLRPGDRLRIGQSEFLFEA